MVSGISLTRQGQAGGHGWLWVFSVWFWLFSVSPGSAV
jgi:hypothetical protein